MVVALAEVGGKDTVILGLSAMNLQRLKDGEPILMTEKKHGKALAIIGRQVLIVAGETEEHILRDMLKATGNSQEMIAELQRLVKAAEFSPSQEPYER